MLSKIIEFSLRNRFLVLAARVQILTIGPH
jgi:Cu/Ag efflux pump CusA